jgi:omega-hydroxy-beta-dihydromenaquinone-9 sulfotransferase
VGWRDAFLSRFGPGGFAGITLGRWLGILREIGFAIDRPYWGRAAVVTAGSVPNTLLAWVERVAYARRVRRAEVAPPLFVLGAWRSGTTHLHNLLAQDGRFAFPNTYQVYYPATFLLTERASRGFVEFFMPPTRPQDNMAIGGGLPQEDEFAVCALTGLSPMMEWVAPGRAAHYDRYLTLRDAAPGEVTAWKAALSRFIRKLSFKYGGRPLVLKSPAHTGRIRLLLELFPDARFVHIRRNPYDVFRSMMHLLRTAAPYWALQRPDFGGAAGRAIRWYRAVYDAFFADRGLIPAGRYCEIDFEALEADPVGQLRDVYEALGLPDFKAVEPALARYAASLVGYQKNKLPELTPDERSRVEREWGRCFEEWGYPTRQERH